MVVRHQDEIVKRSDIIDMLSDPRLHVNDTPEPSETSLANLNVASARHFSEIRV